MKKILMSIISLAFMALSTSALAATTAPAPLAVSATGVISCTSTSTDIAFGNYDGTVDIKPASASAGAQCNAGGVLLTIRLDNGAHYDSANNTRRLANGGSFLNYEIYINNQYTTIFATGARGSSLVGATDATTHAVSKGAWGLLPAGQSLVAGAYSDIVNVTVVY